MTRLLSQVSSHTVLLFNNSLSVDSLATPETMEFSPAEAARPPKKQGSIVASLASQSGIKRSLTMAGVESDIGNKTIELSGDSSKGQAVNVTEDSIVDVGSSSL